jgi:hypothetical protein
MGSLIDINDKEICASAPRPTGSMRCLRMPKAVQYPVQFSIRNITAEFLLPEGGGMQSAVIMSPFRNKQHTIWKVTPKGKPWVSALCIPVEGTFSPMFPCSGWFRRSTTDSMYSSTVLRWVAASLTRQGLDCSTEEVQLSPV